MNAAPAEHVRHCPRCKGVILWCDGEPSPELVLTIRAGQPVVSACGRCIGKQVGGAPAPTPTPAPTPPPVDPRPIRQIIAEEGGKVVELGSQALDIVERVANFWDKLKPRKGPR
jgi:hypothetical protein